MFNLKQFISKNVIMRPESMFIPDIEEHASELSGAIEGRSVLVIGGAGSIGSSFIKAILLYKPGALVIADINENALTELTRDLRSTPDQFIPDDYLPYPMDYASPVFARMFRARGGFDIVANFSAHKHVRSEKDIYSVEALLSNNVIHAAGLLDLLSEYPPQAYFCVSTDKAANPVNIMGASKRIMEDLIFSYSDRFPVKTARFANVAFSNGSLPAGFLERMNRFQPLSAPSDVRRYFVSPEESGQICMLSCMLGDNRNIFFPRLEEAQMMTFDEIARRLLQEQGYQVLECASDEEAIRCAEELKQALISGEDDPSHIPPTTTGIIRDSQSNRLLYPVHFSPSDTSGEKAYEEFYTDTETVDMNRFRSLGVITDKPIPDRASITGLISELSTMFERTTTTKEDVVTALKAYLPYFEHIETGRSLDGKM